MVARIAIFMPAWAKYMFSTVPPRDLTRTAWPLLGLRLPVVMFWVVIPEANASAKAGSPESSPSIARTWALIGTESSLLLAPVAGMLSTLNPVWEWLSTIPGMTLIPVASITSAPAGTGMPAPTASIFPPRITTVPPGIGSELTG